MPRRITSAKRTPATGPIANQRRTLGVNCNEMLHLTPQGSSNQRLRPLQSALTWRGPRRSAAPRCRSLVAVTDCQIRITRRQSGTGSRSTRRPPYPVRQRLSGRYRHYARRTGSGRPTSGYASRMRSWHMKEFMQRLYRDQAAPWRCASVARQVAPTDAKKTTQTTPPLGTQEERCRPAPNSVRSLPRFSSPDVYPHCCLRGTHP